MKLEADNIAISRDGAYIAGALPYIEADIEKLLRVLDNRAMQMDLTAEKALPILVERLAYIKLLNKLKQKVQIGSSQTVGDTHGED